MYKIIFIIALCVSSIVAMPYGLNENGNEEELYVLAPLSRVRRQSLFGGGPRHQLGASVFANRDFGRPTFGGQLGYTHIPSGNNLNFGASHTQGFGTELKAQGTYNFFKNLTPALVQPDIIQEILGVLLEQESRITALDWS